MALDAHQHGEPDLTITTYPGLKDAVGNWLIRGTSDSAITDSFDDFLAMHESRMYYGAEAVPEIGLPAAEPLRIREMEFEDAAFGLTPDANVTDLDNVLVSELGEVLVSEDFVETDFVPGIVPQPAGFLELISARLNSPERQLIIVADGVADNYVAGDLDGVRLVSITGPYLRFLNTPGQGDTATLKYFGKLETPTEAGVVNWILTNAPNVYLHGCLLEAAIRTGDADSARLYHGMYCSAVRSLNQRRNRELAAASNMRLRVRGMTP